MEILLGNSGNNVNIGGDSCGGSFNREKAFFCPATVATTATASIKIESMSLLASSRSSSNISLLKSSSQHSADTNPSSAYTISARELADTLLKKEKDFSILILDIRTLVHYKACHLVNAVHLVLPAILMKRPGMTVEKLTSFVFPSESAKGADFFELERWKRLFEKRTAASLVVIIDYSRISRTNSSFENPSLPASSHNNESVMSKLLLEKLIQERQAIAQGDILSGRRNSKEVLAYVQSVKLLEEGFDVLQNTLNEEERNLLLLTQSAATKNDLDIPLFTYRENRPNPNLCLSDSSVKIEGFEHVRTGVIEFDDRTTGTRKEYFNRLDTITIQDKVAFLSNAAAPIATSKESENSCFDANNNPISCKFPLKVLPFLYLGDAKCASKIDSLCECGITHILNVARECQGLSSDSPIPPIKYQKIELDDSNFQDLTDAFSVALEFVNKALEETEGKGKILVHCKAGKSRSVSIILSLLMTLKHWTLNESMDYLKEQIRLNSSSSSANGGEGFPMPSPNLNFWGQLISLSEQIQHKEAQNP